jgi:hypothetical protein
VIERRSAIRRCLGTAAAAGLSLLVLAPTASSETREITSGFWAGSRLTTPSKVAVPNEPLAGYVKRDGTFLPTLNVTITMERAPGIPTACTVAVGQPDRDDNTSEGLPVWAHTTVSCNGAYPYTIAASDKPPLSATRTMPPLTSTLLVEVPPQPVNGVTASVAEGSRNVTVTWTASASPALDFLGYRVERRLGSGQWVTVGSVEKGTTSMVDDTVPADPGEYAYRVRGRRAGATGNEVPSAEGNVDKVTLAAGDPSSSTSTTTAGGGTDGGTTPTNPDGSGGVTTPSTTADGKLIPKIVNSGTKRGRVNGTPAPGLGSSTQNGLGVLLTPVKGELSGEDDDGGFGETLPFGDPSIDGSLADEEDGSSLFYEGTGGRGMAVPVAVGFVFFAWAIHLRFLARAARPEAGQVAYAETWDPFDPFYDPML